MIVVGKSVVKTIRSAHVRLGSEARIALGWVGLPTIRIPLRHRDKRVRCSDPSVYGQVRNGAHRMKKEKRRFRVRGKKQNGDAAEI